MDKKKRTSIMFFEVLIAVSGAWNESVANGTKRWKADQNEPINRKMNRADQTWSRTVVWLFRPLKNVPLWLFSIVKILKHNL